MNNYLRNPTPQQHMIEGFPEWPTINISNYFRNPTPPQHMIEGVPEWPTINISNYFRNPTPPQHMVEGVPEWPTWTVDSMNYMVLDSYPRTAINYVKTWATPDNH